MTKHRNLSAVLAGFAAAAGINTMSGIANAKEYRPPAFVRNSQSRKSAPGAKRKGIKYMKPIPRNEQRRACKPAIAGFAHGMYPIGRAPAPSLDQVRDLERKHEIKLHVIAGKLYIKDTTIPFKP